MMLRTTSLFAALVVLAFAATGFISQSEAAPTTYEMTGSVVYSGIAGINADEPFEGKFTYDPQMPLYEVDEILSQIDGHVIMQWGVYRKGPPNDPFGMSVTFGTRTIATGNSNLLNLTVVDAVTGSNDRFTMFGYGLSDPAFSHLGMGMILAANGLNKFSSIHLPESFDLAVLPRAKIYFDIPGEINTTELELSIETLERRYLFAQFRLGGGVVSFGEVIGSGNIRAVAMGELTDPALQFFGTQVRQDERFDGFEQVEVRLSPATSTDVVGSTGMVVSRDQVAENILPLSCWDFTYDEDPDFTNTEISFSVLPPEGVTHLGMELIDANGN